MTPFRALSALLVLQGLALAAQGAKLPSPPLEIQVVQPLSFGGLLVDPSGGGLALTADGAVIPLGSGIQPGAQPSATEARFRLTGPPKTPFRVEVDPASPVLAGPGGTGVRLAEWHASLSGLQGTFDESGQAELKLGGRLDIGVNALPGLYTVPQARLLLHVPSLPGGSVALPFPVSVLLRTPLRLVNLGPLDFGVLLPGSRPGRFEVLPEGGCRGEAGGPILLKGAPRPALFAIQGHPGTSYTIQIPQRLWMSGPGVPLAVHAFTCSVPLSGVLPPGGLSFGVGASLLVDPAQHPGAYGSTFLVTVHYP